MYSLLFKFGYKKAKCDKENRKKVVLFSYEKSLWRNG